MDGTWTLRSSAGPGSLQIYFRQPEGEPLSGPGEALGAFGITIRGHGSYAIAAEAARADGTDRVNVGNVALVEALAQRSLPVTPDWLVALIRRASTLASGSEDGAPVKLNKLLDPPPRFDAMDDDDELTSEDEPDPALWQHPDLSYLGSGRTAPPAFPLDALGEAWSPWCAGHAQARGVPVDYVAGTLLAATAALIGNRRWPQASKEWREPPVLWVALVGAPGSGKTPAQEPVLDLVRALERDAATRLLISGTNPAAIGPLLREHPAGLLLHRDELGGWLGKLNRDAGDGGERELWLASHGGRRYGLDRLKDPWPASLPI